MPSIEPDRQPERKLRRAPPRSERSIRAIQPCRQSTQRAMPLRLVGGASAYARGARVTGRHATRSLENTARERKHDRRRHPLRALAHRLPAYRRRAHRAVQLALSRAITAASSCCGSRIPTRRARPSRRSTRSSTGCAGSASTGTATTHFQSECADRHAEVAHALLAARPRLSLLMTPGGARRAARGGAGRAAAVPHPQPLARPRPTGRRARRSSSASRRRRRARR